MFDAFVPFSLAAFPAAFFIAYGRPNQERSSPPLLTVLLLLTAERQEEGDGASEREDGIPGVWAPEGSFFWHSAEAKHPAASAGYRKTACVLPPSQQG